MKKKLNIQVLSSIKIDKYFVCRKVASCLDDKTRGPEGPEALTWPL